MPQPGPANVNVSIRVLSPGDNGPVNQTNTTPTPDPAAGPVGEPTWLWTWTYDWCGTITELSTVAGEGTGLDWAWNWDWSWDCESSGVPMPGDASPGDINPGGGDTAPPAENGSATPAPSSPMPELPADALATPVSVPLPTVTQDWESRVSWAIPSVTPPWLSMPLPFQPLAAPWDEASWPIPSGAAPIGIAVDVALPSVVQPTGAASGQPPVLVVTSAGDLQIVISVQVPLPPTLDFIPRKPDGAPRPDRRRTRAADPLPRAARAAPSSPATASWSAPTAERPAPRKGAGATATATASPRSDARDVLPFGPSRPLQASGSAPAGGGSVPSLLTFGFATIIGLFVFAAPGLGRRIRLARIPSPRSRSHSPLDRPG